MRTVAAKREQLALFERPAHPGKSTSCTYCTTPTPRGVRHDYCPGEIHSTAPGRKDDRIWQCQCWKEGHPS